MLTLRSCSQRTLVSPRRNHSNSTMIDRRWSFLVVSKRKAVGEVEAHLRPEQRARAGAGAVHLLDALVEDLLPSARGNAAWRRA